MVRFSVFLLLACSALMYIQHQVPMKPQRAGRRWFCWCCIKCLGPAKFNIDFPSCEGCVSVWDGTDGGRNKVGAEGGGDKVSTLWGRTSIPEEFWNHFFFSTWRTLHIYFSREHRSPRYNMIYIYLLWHIHISFISPLINVTEGCSSAYILSCLGVRFLTQSVQK